MYVDLYIGNIDIVSCIDKIIMYNTIKVITFINAIAVMINRCFTRFVKH